MGEGISISAVGLKTPTRDLERNISPSTAYAKIVYTNFHCTTDETNSSVRRVCPRVRRGECRSQRDRHVTMRGGQDTTACTTAAFKAADERLNCY
ncbi:hypothetical protein E2C01_074338 [Portunus trituberculatus]|uniref:Uncharacterized protein n=1 Tax=Portunus trituberculatus TaxID=210409 RepID=A0A5B7I7S3_PORTR|nr:hypothetical protein [Portunus trituberculatus]